MSIRKRVEEVMGSPVVSEKPLGGGCIADTRKVDLADGRSVCVKSGSEPAVLECEAEGLRELATAEAIRVPQVYHYDQNGLVLEFISQGRKRGDFGRELGRRLAAMHKVKGRAFGFKHDNFIGESPQKNTPVWNYDPSHDVWPRFYFEYRLQFQVELAERRGGAPPELRRSVEALESRIEELLAGTAEEPSLLHGDLWGGNYLVAEDGEPCLIDPAVYYGHREAELAMTSLFGGFSPEFYEGYEEVYPLVAGYPQREPLYQLYHVLNHMNLFGGGYAAQAMAILRRYT